jgi:hypothetical protein
VLLDEPIAERLPLLQCHRVGERHGDPGPRRSPRS